jgi:hypothetical protein
VTTENAIRFESAVTGGLPRTGRPTEEQLLQLALAFRTAFGLTDDEYEKSLKSLQTRLAINMDTGTVLTATYVPWLASRKASINPFFWNRYRQLLAMERRPPAVLNVLDGITDDLLDLAGDPQLDGAWNRRGLVMGDVQSGKTGTYTGLICKAADAGYPVVILLTGSLENLRRQTQERLDIGFVGFDSAVRLSKAQVGDSRYIGVGLLDRSRMGMVFTSCAQDFRKSVVNSFNFRLASMTDPVLLVVKKNRQVLANLEDWLRSYNAGHDGRISQPLLLIDDEADAGSVNTASLKDDPTKVNEAIRRLLRLFKRSSYVGFTATPFANVFVDSDTNEGMIGDDLFPADYIWALEAPDNYVGPMKILRDDGETIVPLEDAQEHFPTGHRSHLVVEDLPDSLYEAARCYLIATTIRDLRQQDPPHRSMLVNVSPWTRVQNDVASLLDAWVRAAQRDIRNFSALSEEEALENPTIAALHETWKAEFSKSGSTWQEVQLSLNEAVQPVVVKAVNQTTGAASLDYRDQGEKGLRVIAVGGNSLSRGLTLEGLTTSYFFRNSLAYDTLMQMGRWFGYRDDYEDLCRLWMAEDAQGNYAYIAGVIDELRDDLKRMKRQGFTPSEFGLRVRSHPGALIVTARNKMRRATKLVFDMSLDGKLLETTRLPLSPAGIAANNDLVGRWIDGIRRDHGEPTPSKVWGVLGWSDIPKSTIGDILRQFRAHPLNYDFQGEPLATFLADTTEARLDNWEVRIPSGSWEGPPVRLGEKLLVKPRVRRVVRVPESKSILVSGSSSRVGSPEDERLGLTREQVGFLQDRTPGKTVPGDEYRQLRDHPLLILNVIWPYERPKGSKDKSKKDDLPEDLTPLIALSLSLPGFDDKGVKLRLEYLVNDIYFQSMLQEMGDDFEVEDELN